MKFIFTLREGVNYMNFIKKHKELIVILLAIVLILGALFYVVGYAHASAEPVICQGQGIGQDQEGCLTPTNTPSVTSSPTPTFADCDQDNDNPDEDDLCTSETPTATPSVDPSGTPTVTPTDTPNTGGPGDGKSDGKSDGLGCGSHSCNNVPVPGVPDTGRGIDR